MKFIVTFRANGEQLKAQIVLNTSSWEVLGNATNFSYNDVPELSGYVDTTTNIYIYSGKKTQYISIHSIIDGLIRDFIHK